MTTRHLQPLPISAQDDLVMVGREALQPTEARELAVRYREASAQLVRAAEAAEEQARQRAIRTAAEAKMQALREDGWEVHCAHKHGDGLAVAVRPDGESFTLDPQRFRKRTELVMLVRDLHARVRYHRDETRVRVHGGRVAHTVTRQSPEWCIRCKVCIGGVSIYSAPVFVAEAERPDCKAPKKRAAKVQRQLTIGEQDA